jgi:hypothetical protein
MQVTYYRHRDVSQLPSTRLRYQSGQDSQQQGTQGLAKTSQHGNSTVRTNIRVVGWVTKYKQYK